MVSQTEDSIQVDWKNPGVIVDYFKLTHASPDGQGGHENVVMSQEARTKHTIVGQSAVKHPSACQISEYVHFNGWQQYKCVFSAGLNPGTQYQIGVQAIKGESEGKASFATGVTGQYALVTIYKTVNKWLHSFV